MTVKVGDQLLNGQVVVAEVNGSLVTKIVFPNIQDGANNPLTITYDPGRTLPEILLLAQSIIDILG